MDLPIVDGCRPAGRSSEATHRVRQPVVLAVALALVAAVGAQLVAAEATRARSSELRSTPSSTRSAQADAPALERTAFMAGGPLRFPTLAGEHLVVARGNALEVWHAASGEARGHLALPRGVRGIALEVGAESADAHTETRIVATYGPRGLAVVALSAGGALRQVARHEIVSLELAAGSGPPTVSLDPGVALVDGHLYLPRRGAFTGYDDAMLTVAALHEDGSFTVVGEAALGRGEVWRMLRHGDHLYGLIGRTVHHARSADRPFVVDITARDRPRLLADGALDASGAPRDFGWLSGMAIAGRHLLLSEAGPLDSGAAGDPDAPGALHVLDVSDPAAPRQVGELPVAPRPVALAAHGTQALIVGDRLTAGWVGGGPEPATLVRVDLGRPEAPRIVDRTAIERSAVGVASDGLRAAVSTYGGDLAVYEGLADEMPRRAWGVEGPGAVLGVAADGDVAVARLEASAGQREVVVLDVRDARRPRAIARVPDSGGVSRLALRGDVLLMVEADGFGLLRVVDLSRPDAPVERGRIDGREQGEGLWMGRMAWRSDHEIVFGGRERLSTVDLSDLDRPFVKRSWLHGVDHGGLLDVEGVVALVGSGFGSQLHLVALDERLGDRQHAITGLDSGGPITFDLHQGRAWIADERDVRVVAIGEEPLGHRPVAVYERLLERGPAGTPIRRWDRYLLAVEWDRLRVFDTRVDGPPVERQVIELPEQIVDVAIDGDRVYVAALEGGLHVFGAPETESQRPWRLALPWLRAE